MKNNSLSDLSDSMFILFVSPLEIQTTNWLSQQFYYAIGPIRRVSLDF